MDEALLRQLTRQLKILNFWITVVGSLILITLVIAIVLLIKVVTFVHNTQDQISNLQRKTQQTLDVRQKLCNSNSVSGLLQKGTDVCK